MAEAAKPVQEIDKKRRKEEEDREKEQFESQEQIDTEIKMALHAPDIKPESFVGLSSWLNSQNGIRSLKAIDIQTAPGWIKLTEEEQDAMLNLALRYLLEAEIQSTAPNQHQHCVANAFTALRLHRPTFYSGLSRDVWKKCGVELLKAAIHDNLDLLGPLLDTLSGQFPDIATEAILNVLSQELQAGYISIINIWGNRLSLAQAIAILAIADDPATDPDRRYQIFASLVQQEKKAMVRTHLESVFSCGWNLPPDPALHKLRRLAFELSPASYIRPLLDSLAADSKWGRQWIETTIGSHDSAFLYALHACNIGEVAELYIWLHCQYPPETCPVHDEAYIPDALDNIHALKRDLIGYLTNCGIVGATAALQAIADYFPSETWLTNCVTGLCS